MNRKLTLVALTLFLTAAARPVSGHFPWIAVNEEGQAIYFFGETPADRTYKIPPAITKAKVSVVDGANQRLELKLNVVERGEFVGMESVASVPDEATLTSKVTYGVYHGSRLDYYTQHRRGKLPSRRDADESVSKRLDLNAQVIDTDSGVDVFVIWKGKPLTDAEVKLFCAEGHEEGSATTDQNGRVSFSDKQVEDGLNGIMVGHTSSGESGNVGEQKYESVSHYLTATFMDPEDFERSAKESKVSVASDIYPQIPEMVTSFGAAVTDNSLYIYGGHKGRAHQYYSEAQANTLWRLDLKTPKSWESLGAGPRLQGLAMVAHGGKLYRIGGFTAKNSEGKDKDLWSQDGVACFDPKTKEWQDLPSLPEPRSSFDAAVLGDSIYVIGGWSMKGGEDATWLKTAQKLDLSKQPLQWQSLPEPPFQRRALSVAAHDGKVFAIGGMQRIGSPSTRVDVFDTQSQTWSRGPSLNGEGMDGFGSSAFAAGKKLYVTTYSGALQRLSADGKSWSSLHSLQRDRFFHRLLPLSSSKLLAVGGASMSSGKFEELDVIEVR
jgi:N-acetylneuraminic acid mutarotase